MGQTDLKPTAQGQVESSINDTIDALPKDSTCDNASETIRANADIDIAERRKSVLPDQAGLAAKKASCIESLAHIGGNAPVCGQNEIAR